MAKNAPSVAMPKLDKDFQAEEDHRTLTRAYEVQSDGGRMSGVRRHHRKMSRALTTVGQHLRAKR